ncbi:proline-rich protein [Amanita muscaria]
MWILTGPFDSNTNVDVTTFQKSKLLKTGKSYSLGRKDQPLIIMHKRISKDHGEFQVEGSTNDDITIPSFQPALRYVHKRDKKIKIDRGSARVEVEPSSTETLQDGDVIWPIVGVKISVKWEPVCCYCPPGEHQLPPLIQGCTSLGINLVHTPQPQVTHHLISSFTPSAAIAASLLSASQFVRAEWLEEVIRLGSKADGNPSGGASLEWDFALPLLSKYRPSFSPTLKDSQKAFNVWEPNEERLNMLNDYRFFLLAENRHETGSDMKELIQRGGGLYEVLEAHAGQSKWRQSFVRGNAKEGQKLVVVGNSDSLKVALDEHDWQDLHDEIEGFALPFVSPDAIIQAVINVDVSAFNNALEAEKKLQGRSSQTASSNAESLHSEGSCPQGDPPRPVRSLSRRNAIESQVDDAPIGSSRCDKPKGPSSSAGDHSEDDRPRKSTRRQLNTVTDVVPTTQSYSTAIDLTASCVYFIRIIKIDFTQIPVQTRPKPPKRRREASEPLQETETVRQSPDPESRTKRVRRDFEMSQTQDLNAVAGIYSQLSVPINIGDFNYFNQESQTQTQTQNKAMEGIQRSVPKLPAVLEEEEETQVAETHVPDSRRGVKRKAEATADTETVSMMRSDSTKASKKTKLPVIPEPIEPASDTGASKRPPKSKASDVRQLDTDSTFLKAIASTKKGKKKEDDLDRDFNNLKIARPEIDHREEEWNILDDFGDDTGIRGNFMVIVEMEVKERRAKPDVAPNWQGKPNFKKFKKRAGAPLRGKVELVVSEDNDYGLGPGGFIDKRQTKI